MIVQAQCPSCSTTAGVDETFAGRRVRCRKCGERFQIDPSLFGLPPVGESSSESDSNESDEGGDPALNDFLNDLGSDRAPRTAPAPAAVIPAPRPAAAPRRTPDLFPTAAAAEPEEPAAPRPKNVPLMLLSLILLGGTIAFFVWIDQVKREADASPKAAPASADAKPAPKA